MGGGDLNLKKSWHPSTMRNMEKVWKAEQKHDQEKKRIAELQREIQEEKAREDMQKFAEDSGVVEKKDDVKLDWMYKGPTGAVDREEYLLGRSVDKTFEQLQEAEKKPSTSNHFTSGLAAGPQQKWPPEQVDIERKLLEDPLFAIRKKEMETRSELLKNPIKLKQLREMLKLHSGKTEKKHKKEKKKQKKKKRKSHSTSESNSSDAEGDGKSLDEQIAEKYRKLRAQLLNSKEEKPSSMSHKRNDNHRSSKEHQSPQDKHRSKRRNGSPGVDVSSVERQQHSHRNKRKSDSSDDDRPVKIKKYGLSGLSSRHQATTDRQRAPPAVSHNATTATAKPTAKPASTKLSEEELERRRQEMMANAKWRDKVREKNVAKFKEENKEEKKPVTYSEEFLRKQLSHAASHSSVANRIKSNINNIQRSGRDMDKNFARR